jgi:hypothetical protein
VDWLAASIWGGGGLAAETTWYFTAPLETFFITGGNIAYNVSASGGGSSVPEPGTYALLLAGLGLLGATARRRVRG